MQNLCKLIEDLYIAYKEAIIWITGDFNLPNIDWITNSVVDNAYPLDICNLLIDAFNLGGLSQLVDTPTRNNNILDLFATNRPSLVKSLKILPGISDHELICVESILTATVSDTIPRKLYLWHKADMQLINDKVTEFCRNFLSVCTISTPIQNLWNNLKSFYLECLDLVPFKLRSSSTRNPWINAHIKHLSNKKRRLYNKARSSSLNSDWDTYKSFKRYMQRECRKAHNSYFSRLFDTTSSHGSKKFWSYIKSQRNEQSGVPTLEKDNEMFTDNAAKADILNDQFSSVFTIDNSAADSIPSLDGPSFPDIPSIQIEIDGVSHLLQELDPHKASGPDGISARFLKETSTSIAPAITLIFNASLAQGKLPQDWKNAFVTPVYKKGSRTVPSNYRPISLTCICCKIFEHIISSSITNHLNSHNIICMEQHGFRKHRSCETQLLETLNDLSCNLNANIQTDFLLLDFSKAFDKVSHNRLLSKLSHYGIKGSIYDWIKDFLLGRKQQVVLGNAYSSPCNVLSGVPQGSVLGPLLFIIYINDLPASISSKIRLYADDVILYRAILSNEDAIILQNDLNKLVGWAATWLMSLNLDKCEHLTITNKKHPLSITYMIMDHPIRKVISAKYLGVTITHNLSWTKHVDIITCKANSVRAFLQRNLSQCSHHVKSLAYFTYVRPILEYASVVWSPFTKINIDKIEMVQRKAARFVFNDYHRYSSVSYMLQQLNWDSLEHRRTKAITVMFYKIINNIVSVDFSNFLHRSFSITRGHDMRFLTIPARLNTYYHSFLLTAIRIWNSLPEDIVHCSNLHTFINLLHV